jgi:CHAD domain-containing protein
MLMAYQIEPAKPVGGEIARIACELLKDPAGATPGGSLAERIHHARTNCKKMRALLRLLRTPHHKFFRGENRRLRDAADTLAGFRDAEVLLAATQLLHPAGRAEQTALHGLRRRLASHRQSVLADKRVVAEHFAAFSRSLRASLASVQAWRPQERDFAAIAPQIKATYRRARRLGRRMQIQASGAKYHEWRIAVKTFGYHSRLLRGAWTEGTKPFVKEVDRLGDLLGQEHDLTILKAFVRKAESAAQPAPSVLRLLGIIERHRLQLRQQAQAAERIFAEKPRAYVARLARWWQAAAKFPCGADHPPVAYD